jgi:hypothetical protein
MRNPDMKFGTAACAYALNVMKKKSISTEAPAHGSGILPCAAFRPSIHAAGAKVASDSRMTPYG